MSPDVVRQVLDGPVPAGLRQRQPASPGRPAGMPQPLAQLVLDALVNLTAVLDPDGTIVAVNRAWEEFRVYGGGDPAECSSGASYLAEIDRAAAAGDRDAAQASAGVRAVLDGDVEVFQFDFCCEVPESRWFTLYATPLDAGSGGAVLSYLDITRRKQLERRLAQQATHDQLTGLPNRTLLMDRMEQAFARAVRRDGPVAAMFVDLDHFKLVNDSLGHAVGDRVLREVGRRLTAAVRPSDTVARFGGDEFVVLPSDLAGEGEADALVARVMDCFGRPFAIDGREFTVGATAGLATTRPAAGARLMPLAEELLRDADTAMYHGKEVGRGRSQRFHTTLRKRVSDRLHGAEELRQAVSAGQLVLYYQPQWSCRDGELTGFEALIRWRHPSRGVVGPGDFLPLAEETGLLGDIGRWVLEAGCRQLAVWARRWPDRALSMAVNVAPVQLADAGFVETVRAALAASAAPAGRLVLEVTETGVLPDPDQAIATLAELCGEGVRVALDDFGSGFSSLTHLQLLPVNVVKIDRSFVVAAGAGNGAIAAAVISLAHAMGLQVCAEGVSTPELLALVRDMGCDYQQGFLSGRPMPAAQAEALLRSGARAPQ